MTSRESNSASPLPRPGLGGSESSRVEGGGHLPEDLDETSELMREPPAPLPSRPSGWLVSGPLGLPRLEDLWWTDQREAKRQDQDRTLCGLLGPYSSSPSPLHRHTRTSSPTVGGIERFFAVVCSSVGEEDSRVPDLGAFPERLGNPASVRENSAVPRGGRRRSPRLFSGSAVPWCPRPLSLPPSFYVGCLSFPFD